MQALLPELHKVSEEDAAKRATPPVATTPQDKPTAQPDAQADTALHDGRSNWERLKATIATHNAAHPLAANPTPRPHRPPGKRRKVAHAPSQAAGTAVCADGVLAGKLVAKAPSEEATSVVGLDCEMVGVGLDGLRSALARVCVVRLSPPTTTFDAVLRVHRSQCAAPADQRARQRAPGHVRRAEGKGDGLSDQILRHSARRP